MNAKEFTRQAENLINSPNQRLIGDPNTGYTLLSDDEANRNQLAKYFLNYIYGYKPSEPVKKRIPYHEFYHGFLPGIKKVIFNYPATIVLWIDGTKTVVRSVEDDPYDPEKGLAMAIVKKALGNKGNYYNLFKEWLPKEEDCITVHGSIDENGEIECREYSVTEYASKHDISRDRVYRMIKNGELAAEKKSDRSWVIYD